MDRRRGFTLIELVMVIALIAIVSTLAVGRIGDMRRTAARRVSIANQQAVGRAVETYLSIHDGRLDRLDSLMDAETPLGRGGADDGFDYARTNKVAGSSGYLYCGPCRAAGMSWPFPDAVTEANAGLAPGLRGLLAPYALDEREVRALNDIGLKFLMTHTVWADKSPREAYRERGEDGAWLPDDATIGLSPSRSACVPAMVTNGLVVAAVSPVTNAGRDVYRECGQQRRRVVHRVRRAGGGQGHGRGAARVRPWRGGDDSGRVAGRHRRRAVRGVSSSQVLPAVHNSAAGEQMEGRGGRGVRGGAGSVRQHYPRGPRVIVMSAARPKMV